MISVAVQCFWHGSAVKSVLLQVAPSFAGRSYGRQHHTYEWRETQQIYQRKVRERKHEASREMHSSWKILVL